MPLFGTQFAGAAGQKFESQNYSPSRFSLTKKIFHILIYRQLLRVDKQQLLLHHSLFDNNWFLKRILQTVPCSQTTSCWQRTFAFTSLTIGHLLIFENKFCTPFRFHKQLRVDKEHLLLHRSLFDTYWFLKMNFAKRCMSTNNFGLTKSMVFIHVHFWKHDVWKKFTWLVWHIIEAKRIIKAVYNIQSAFGWQKKSGIQQKYWQ